MNQPQSAGARQFEPTPEEASDEDEETAAARVRKGTMSKNFKFPPPAAEPTPPLPDIPPTVPKHDDVGAGADSDTEEVSLGPAAPSMVEVPPPPPVEKERSSTHDMADEEVGETEEISLE